MKKTSSENRSILIWGVHPVMEFLRAHPDVVQGLYVLPAFGNKPAQRELLRLAEKQGIAVSRVKDFNRHGMAMGAVHQGVAAAVKPVWTADLADIPQVWSAGGQPLVVVCDQVVDPQNLGAIIRSATALGTHAVILPSKGSPAINGVIVKASSGAIAHIKICEVVNLVKALHALKDMGLWVVGLSPEAGTAVWDIDLKGAVALVAGAEGEGLRYLVKKSCDFVASIPLSPAVGSLNVASATSIFLYEAARQRRRGAV